MPSRVSLKCSAMMVMAFDETGQADTRERKVEICGRAYDLLVANGSPVDGLPVRTTGITPPPTVAGGEAGIEHVCVGRTPGRCAPR